MIIFTTVDVQIPIFLANNSRLGKRSTPKIAALKRLILPSYK